MENLPEQVVLIDDHDRSAGVATKFEAHRYGLRHLAVSVVVCNALGEC